MALALTDNGHCDYCGGWGEVCHRDLDEVYGLETTLCIECAARVRRLQPHVRRGSRRPIDVPGPIGLRRVPRQRIPARRVPGLRHLDDHGTG